MGLFTSLRNRFSACENELQINLAHVRPDLMSSAQQRRPVVVISLPGGGGGGGGRGPPQPRITSTTLPSCMLFFLFFPWHLHDNNRDAKWHLVTDGRRSDRAAQLDDLVTHLLLSR